jgi:hypothetical protein
MYSRDCLFMTNQNIYTFAWKFSVVLEHSSIKPNNTCFVYPHALYIQYPNVLLDFKLHKCTAVFVSSRPMRIHILLHNSSWTFVKKASKFTCFVYPKPFKFHFRPFYWSLAHIYILPCLSLQDLSEYINFWMKVLYSSRTFVKKNPSKFTCLNSISKRSISFEATRIYCRVLYSRSFRIYTFV